MALNDREAMAWAVASFLSVVAWLSVAQVTLLGEQLRDLDLDAPNTHAHPGPPESSPLKRKQAENGASSSISKRRRSTLLLDAPPPPPLMGTPRTALDLPLSVPQEFNREPHSRQLFGYSYRYGGVPVPPWEEEEDPTDVLYRDEFMRRGRLPSFWELAWGRPRVERRQSWPPSTSIPKGLRPDSTGSLNG